MISKKILCKLNNIRLFSAHSSNALTINLSLLTITKSVLKIPGLLVTDLSALFFRRQKIKAELRSAYN